MGVLMLVKIQMHLAACISFSLDVHGDILSDERSRVLLAVDYACAVLVHSWDGLTKHLKL